MKAEISVGALVSDYSDIHDARKNFIVVPEHELYAVGKDGLLHEVNPETLDFTNRKLTFTIISMTSKVNGIQDGWCILGLFVRVAFKRRTQDVVPYTPPMWLFHPCFQNEKCKFLEN